VRTSDAVLGLPTPPNVVVFHRATISCGGQFIGKRG
jgi:hypothetical protein